MNRYVLSKRARQDIRRIWKYIAKDNVDAADNVTAKLIEAMERLSAGPDIGHDRADVSNRRYRFLTVHPYVIAYAPKSSPLRIARILHGAQDISRLLGD